MGIAAQVRDFDLYGAVDRTTSQFAGVPPGSSLGTKTKAVVSNPKKLAIVVGVVIAFSVIVALLLATGVLGNVYRAIYMFWPGRPWTHVMRENPWTYLLLAVGLVWLPYTLSPPLRWGRAFVSYVVFWVGFIGGHTFW